MFEISEVGAPATRSSRLADALAKISSVALALTVLPMIYLHLVSIGRLDPLHTTVSDYVSVPGGGAFLALSTIALALATAVLPAQLGLAGGRSRRPPRSASFSVASACSPRWSFPPTRSAPRRRSHRPAPLRGGPVLHRRPDRRGGTGPRRPRCGRLAAVLSGLVGIAFLLSHMPLVFPGFPHADLIATRPPAWPGRTPAAGRHRHHRDDRPLGPLRSPRLRQMGWCGHDRARHRALLHRRLLLRPRRQPPERRQCTRCPPRHRPVTARA